MPHPLGFIHGRFQVLHNDHLKYLLAGKALCDRLTVGITNPDPDTTTCEATDTARSSRENNPLTFGEREQMVRAALEEAGVPPHTFSIVPFPICQPEVLIEKAPTDAVYYLTIYDAWGREKKQRLESLGLTTQVMWERSAKDKGLSGKLVRRAIVTGGDWRSMVPPSVAELIEKWHLQERLAGPSGS